MERVLAYDVLFADASWILRQDPNYFVRGSSYNSSRELAALKVYLGLTFGYLNPQKSSVLTISPSTKRAKATNNPRAPVPVSAPRISLSVVPDLRALLQGWKALIQAWQRQ